MTAWSSVLTDWDEWSRSVIFPLVVGFVAWCAVGILRCLRNILTEFRHTRQQVERITDALEDAGLLPPEGRHPIR